MAMAVDSRQHLNLGYDQIRYPPPQFTNPWVSAPPASSQLYPTSLAPTSTGLDSNPAQQTARPTSVSLPHFPGLPPGIHLSQPPYEPQNLLGASQDLLNPPRSSYATAYSASTSPSYAPTSAPQYSMDYSAARSGSYPYQDGARRSSHPINTQQTQRSSFSDALDASRGMVAMSQADITPRNIYGSQGASRSSSDSYGFPSTHSAHSSISSASTYPSYYTGSVADSSVSDYSSAGESVEPMNSRTLPRPSALVGAALPPAPQSMMGQFSSKLSSSSQKKHKCKICDKRFTRPSSLQTHMYSHTGEKPFACEFEGCGRHFSVVSNLRRHRKVHKGERDHEHDQASPEEM